MKSKLSFVLGCFVLGFCAYWIYHKITQGERSEIAAGEAEGSRREEKLSARQPASVDSKETGPLRMPTNLSFEGLMSKLLPAEIMAQTETRVIDSGEGYMRLGLFRNKIPVEGADFHFAQGNAGEWAWRDGEWAFGAVNFPNYQEGLSERQVENLIADKIASDAERLDLKKTGEFWRIRNNEARQMEVWRIEYRTKEEGLRREALVFDVAEQSLLRKDSALRH